jgi:XTP/dITP diphosphohydrolase
MNKIVVASNNQHKVKEIASLMPKGIELLTLSEIGCFDDIPEEADTLEGNAFQKANYIFSRYGVPCFADDTGLEVEILEGKPGVFSARFSEDVTPYTPKEMRGMENMKKLLFLLEGKTNRNAAFRTVICFIDEIGQTQYFEGKITGTIIYELKGTEGFGYDPVFRPDGFENTFAEMPFELKNRISHRAKATIKFIEYLKNK